MFEFLNIAALIIPFALGSWAAVIFKLRNGQAMLEIIVIVAAGSFVGSTSLIKRQAFPRGCVRHP
jgi:hypothetical membrane protein